MGCCDIVMLTENDDGPRGQHPRGPPIYVTDTFSGMYVICMTDVANNV